MDESTEQLVSLGELGAGADMGLTGRTVFAGDGTLLGTVADVLGDMRGDGPRYIAVQLEAAVARLQAGKRVFVPFNSARLDSDNRVYLDSVTGESAVTLPTTPTATGHIAADATVLDRARAVDSMPGAVAPALGGTHEMVGNEERIVLSEEQMTVGKRQVEVGEVVVHKEVEEQVVRQPVTLSRDHVEVERRPVPDGVGLEPRTEGDVLYIPIVEEELVITKRLVAREELVIRKTRVTEEQIVEETLRRERAEVTGPEGMREPGRGV
jgi:uncharacterized protein (TIGR02271 family)